METETTNTTTTTTTSSETTEIEAEMENCKLTGFLEDFMFQVPRGPGGWDMSEVVYQVRGPTYLKSKKKTPSMAPLFEFVGLQMAQIPDQPKAVKGKKAEPASSFKTTHIATESWSALPRDDLQNEYLIVNYIVPGTPGVQVVMYFRATEEARDAIRHDQESTEKFTSPNGKATETPPLQEGWQSILHQFWQADQTYCDARFKVIPCMDKTAPWAVKMAVGEKPALVGKKLQQFYFRGPNYFEVDMDIASSSTAARILSLVRSLSTSLIVDVGVTIEATGVTELPERMLCQCRLWGLDFKNAVPHPPTEMRSHTC
mmetsp:Transcript_80/g.147  ORF Transcript_80/g.147 Transcript_80/m.147 type:complete len:315 (+) Transcript_80:158-1102(+)|eukprot:CAMPEP_0114441324 /NCGR_PEP_ID=MMETSP0103-20121206/16307_1 /TAXON_ID=37642 ORGANISM="Paraphysomonas imperforata, Strain PA2" /NCGR_SAMPLE_ID=MMETSP0103 /ASSEMBLY_ACC=CAM_ASM_000201 /LENGTH=314 /DNA_ID=CAMNT_0001612417 /DNA_START=76 /DNA_END=1020 /DNA_ORIENTATION=-